MDSVFSFVVGLLTAALSLLGFVQQHPELPPASRDQANQIAQQAITQATQALNSTPNKQPSTNYTSPSLSFTYKKGALTDTFTLDDAHTDYTAGSVQSGTNRNYSIYNFRNNDGIDSGTNKFSDIQGIVNGSSVRAMVLVRHSGNNIFELTLFLFRKTSGGWQQIAYANFPDDGGRTTIDSFNIQNNQIVLSVRTSGPDRNYHETYVPKRYVFDLTGSQLMLQSQNSETANWKTYRNELYGLEFKYPTEYRNGGLKGGDELFDAPQLKSSWPTLAGSLTLSKAVDPNREGTESIILRIFSNPKDLAIRDWLKTDEAIKQVGKPDAYLTLTVKNISGNEFLIFNSERCSAPCQPNAYFASNGFAYQFVTTTGMVGPSNGLIEDANRILSTFKFTK